MEHNSLHVSLGLLTHPVRHIPVAAHLGRSAETIMKITIIIAACILAAAAVFINRKQEPARQSTPFSMHTSERDGRISTVIPLGKGKNLYLFGKKDGEHFTFTTFSYTLEGKTIFSHNDKTEDGVLDELQFREPPFSDMALFSLQQDGSYSPAAKQRKDEVMKTEQIYRETFEQVFSGNLNSGGADKAVQEAHKKVKELSNQ